MALISTSEYKAYAGISGTGDDTAIGVYVNIANAWIARMCGRTFESATYTEYYDGDGTDTLVLKNTPITSITSIKFRNADDTLDTALSSTLYRVDLATGVIKLLGSTRVWGYDDTSSGLPATELVYSSRFTEGHQNWQVVYVGGYATIPDDLKYAAYLTVDLLFNNRGQAGMFNAESIGQYSYQRASRDQGLASIMAVLGGFRRLAV